MVGSQIGTTTIGPSQSRQLVNPPSEVRRIVGNSDSWDQGDRSKKQHAGRDIRYRKDVDFSTGKNKGGFQGKSSGVKGGKGGGEGKFTGGKGR
eukprot:7979283-Alexandrium_andersonii.AAC.1